MHIGLPEIKPTRFSNTNNPMLKCILALTTVNSGLSECTITSVQTLEDFHFGLTLWGIIRTIKFTKLQN